MPNFSRWRFSLLTYLVCTLVAAVAVGLNVRSKMSLCYFYYASEHFILTQTYGWPFEAHMRQGFAEYKGLVPSGHTPLTRDRGFEVLPEHISSVTLIKSMVSEWFYMGVAGNLAIALAAVILVGWVSERIQRCFRRA